MPKMGLHFHKGDARIIRAHKDWAAANGFAGEDLGLYDKAADSAEAREPLVVVCEHPSEAQQMAILFARMGIREPSVVTLSG